MVGLWVGHSSESEPPQQRHHMTVRGTVRPGPDLSCLPGCKDEAGQECTQAPEQAVLYDAHAIPFNVLMI